MARRRHAQASADLRAQLPRGAKSSREVPAQLGSSPLAAKRTLPVRRRRAVAPPRAGRAARPPRLPASWPRSAHADHALCVTCAPVRSALGDVDRVLAGTSGTGPRRGSLRAVSRSSVSSACASPRPPWTTLRGPPRARGRNSSRCAPSVTTSTSISAGSSAPSPRCARRADGALVELVDLAVLARSRTPKGRWAGSRAPGAIAGRSPSRSGASRARSTPRRLGPGIASSAPRRASSSSAAASTRAQRPWRRPSGSVATEPIRPARIVCPRTIRLRSSSAQAESAAPPSSSTTKAAFSAPAKTSGYSGAIGAPARRTRSISPRAAAQLWRRAGAQRRSPSRPGSRASARGRPRPGDR